MALLAKAGVRAAPSQSGSGSDCRLPLTRKPIQEMKMLSSRIIVLCLLALAQQFTAANALADVCTDTAQKPDSTDNCPDGGGGGDDRRPDLVPSITRVSFAGGKVSVAMTIGNLGQTTSGGTKLQIALFNRKGAAVLPPFRTLEIPVGGVQPSATLALTAEADVPPGVFFNRRNNKVCVTADAESDVDEINETNNKVCREVGFSLTDVLP